MLCVKKLLENIGVRVMSLARATRQYLGVRALLPPDLQTAKRDPTVTDTAYVKGTLWLNTVGLTTWMYSGTSGVWIALGTGATGGVVTINSLSPVGGNIIIAPTANQVGVANAGHTVTLSTPATFIAPGTIASTTTITSGTALIATTAITAGTAITSTLGNITATNGNLVLGTAGNKILVPTGANASVGTSAAMTAGTITVSTTAVTASSIIFVSHNTLAGTPGAVSAPAASRVAGTSFVITSSSNTDTSTVNWWIIN
jgi:hypothetical protein